ncbi:hypothetical protein BX265_4982 [Streptomyces sp. TLI_235]|nr:hypothetical protein BX265_4982 [Streptomyces sp. TLI_235]
MRTLAYALAALVCSTVALALVLAAAHAGTRSETPRD